MAPCIYFSSDAIPRVTLLILKTSFQFEMKNDVKRQDHKLSNNTETSSFAAELIIKSPSCRASFYTEAGFVLFFLHTKRLLVSSFSVHFL